MNEAIAGRLCRVLKKGMMRLGKAVRIIPSVKYPVQNLNTASTSYVASISILAETLPPSYVARAGIFPKTLSTSYVTAGTASFHTPTPEVSIPLAFVLLVGTSVQAEFQEFTDSDTETLETETISKNDSTPEKRGIIYARVSSNEQAQSGYSLETQVKNLRQKAEKEDISLVSTPIRDEGESGTNFDRDGIKEVFQLANAGEISHLLVDDADRLGRTTPETLYFIHLLQTECEVEILTSAGQLDTTKIRGLIETTMRTLMSHVAVKGRARKATNTRIHRFVEQRQWSSWFHTIPLGYIERNDGWIEKDTDETDAAEILFEHFLESESYSATTRYINEECNLKTNLSRSQTKQLLQKPVYKGEPTIPINSVSEGKTEKTVDDPALAIVDDEIFDRVQQIIKRIARQNSTDDGAVDVDDLVDEFGLFPVVKSSPAVEVICSECDSAMVKNGQRDLDGSLKSHNYLCNSCGSQRRFPYVREYEDMQERAER